jgi:hypothetical protein
VWWILAGVSVFFRHSNILTRIIPIGNVYDEPPRSGASRYLSQELITPLGHPLRCRLRDHGDVAGRVTMELLGLYREVFKSLGPAEQFVEMPLDIHTGEVMNVPFSLATPSGRGVGLKPDPRMVLRAGLPPNMPAR